MYYRRTKVHLRKHITKPNLIKPEATAGNRSWKKCQVQKTKPDYISVRQNFRKIPESEMNVSFFY